MKSNTLHPLDITEARAAARQASENQRFGEDQLREAYRASAEAEQSYRKALATRITELHADGAAWTVCADLARGDENVAKLRYDRDVAEGVKEAALQAAWRHSADRRDVGRFCDWSARIDLASGGEQEQPSPGYLGAAA